MSSHKTSAWPLAWVYVGLIVYASLYPFVDWRDQGIAPWAYLAAPLTRYWTWFDLISNVLGYAPLGFLFALSALRTGHSAKAVMRATLSGGALSLLMEALQSYLPARVPSSVDLVLNLGGAWLGAVTATLMEKMGAIDRWSHFRARWFVADSRGALVLLALWPVALLFPAAVPLGLGQVFERVETALAEVLADTPFLEWLPVRDVEFQPLVPGAEMICVMLGALIPCLLGFCVIPSVSRRARLVMVVLAAGIGVTALSAALSYGPAHAWSWFSLPVKVGIGMTAVLALAMLNVPGRVSAGLMLLALGIYLSVINQAPNSAYFAHTLHAWEQGRFIRFHGVGQWLGWLWPYMALVYVLTRVWGHQR
jgi:VanZ family protein